ncbi:flagellar basal-body rod protein FlgG [Halarsenatibacter silvermanii]|uniref:Flagellar basal-body rod protein FlgG n=1 Tax=Halarsenatibacter silvermanii TaxID=321763 RepID=A0A1G9MKH8_9FIRM|nr:flagellar basal-body rod protein FlgG [Halarsenatibacter silvermanii]SDL74780.1 flagellar basal-body rod protein FlgG [Halarsenatibacter silvermanii]
MIRALYTSATGMKTQQTNTDIISNNLSNVNTTGFKRQRPNFQDLVYEESRHPGTPNAMGEEIPVGTEIGHGARISATQKLFTQGSFEETGNPLDLVIEGDGFFQVTMPDGSTAYTRDGAFKMDSTGSIVTADGHSLEPPVEIPEDATDISVTSDGTVSYRIGGEDEMTEAGEIELVHFTNPAGLSSQGRNLFQETDASGPPIAGRPGEDGLGTIEQGFLEMSNVEVVDEMVNMITAQRAYESNSRSIQASDEMLQTANQLRR